MKTIAGLLCMTLALSPSAWSSDFSPYCAKAADQVFLSSLVAPIKPKFGLEWEGAFAFKKGTVMQVADALTQKIEGLKRLHPGWDITTPKNNSISVSFKRGPFEYKWNLTMDSSIVTDKSRTMPFELVSPILHDQVDQEIYKEVMSALVDFGVHPRPNSAAIHVHTSAEFEKNPQLVFDMLKTWEQIEPVFLKAFPISNSRRSFAQPVNQEIYAFVKKYQATLENLHLLVTLAGGRNRSLNVLALPKHGTLEFRLFNSSADKKVINFCLDFISVLAHKVIEVSSEPAQLNKLLSELEQVNQKERDPLVKMQKIFDLLGYQETTARELVKRMQTELLEIKKSDREHHYQDPSNPFTAENSTVVVVLIFITVFALVSTFLQYFLPH